MFFILCRPKNMLKFFKIWIIWYFNMSYSEPVSRLLKRIRGRMIVSCQPVDDGPMDRPDIVAAMAQAAVAGGAAALRIEGIVNLCVVRPLVDVAIIGIVKSDCVRTPVRITAKVEDAHGLIDAGADIIAYDATNRPRQDCKEEVLRTILDSGAVAMADCSTVEDAKVALTGGATIIGTTLSGYTVDTATRAQTPDLELVHAFSLLGAFVMAEGRFSTPELAAEAIRAGADCVTVGSALTRLEHVTRLFSDAVNGSKE